jgi:hypothetical protein
MAVETHVDHARTRVEAEREALEDKRTAIGRFAERVGEVPTAGAPSTAGQPVAAGATQSLAARPATDGCQAVRQAFAETIRPHSVEDVADPEPLLATIRTELSETVAAALAPDTTTRLTPTLRRSVAAEARDRRRETAVTIDALGRERSSLEDAAAVVEDLTDWLVAANEDPLEELGFDALRERHERLDEGRDRLEDVVAERQAYLQGATSAGGEVAVGHESLVTYLYQDFPVDHPVLATAARLEEACAGAQRTVRDHLVGRA